ncbi:MAG TPA: hypothetical protein VGK61_00260 [Planctomycetota bacterium]|jgi:hypothetical protein
MRLAPLVGGWVAFAASSALAQEVEVTRRGDGTVVIPAAGGEVTITTRTEGRPMARQVPRRGLRIEEKHFDQFLRERRKVSDEWT